MISFSTRVTITLSLCSDNGAFNHDTKSTDRPGSASRFSPRSWPTTVSSAQSSRELLLLPSMVCSFPLVNEDN